MKSEHVLILAVVFLIQSASAVPSLDSNPNSCKIPIFDQTKYAQRLGTCNGCTIKSDGCVVTSLAMALSYYGITVTVPAEQSSTGAARTGMDPAILDDWFTWKGGYSTNTKKCPGKCLMNWQILPGDVTVSDRQYNPKTDGISQETYRFIDSALSGGNLVIAGVHWDSKPEDSHFVLITGRAGNTYEIIDPYGGRETTLKKGTLGSYIIDHYRSIRGTKTQCSGVSWEFNTKGDLEGWELHNQEDYSVEGGKLFIDPDRDPWIQSPSIMADAESYNMVELNMSSNAPDDTGAIYFTTSDSPVYSDNKKIEFSVKTGSEWHTYRIYMAGHPFWNGQITGIRVDPANNGVPGTDQDTVGFDYIKLGHENPVILKQSIYPNNPKPGDTLDFVYSIENPFSNPVENVRLGARIRTSEPQSDWIDDWDRDKVVTLTPGIKDYSRSFEKTQNLKPVFYDAQWVLLNDKTSAWLDSKDMIRILKVVPAATSTPDSISTPTSTTSGPFAIPVEDILTELINGIRRLVSDIMDLFIT